MKQLPETDKAVDGAAFHAINEGEYEFHCEHCEGELDLEGDDGQYEYYRCLSCKKVRVVEKSNTEEQ